MQEKNKQMALRYLTIRMRSEQEMRDYLKKKQVSGEEADEIIAYLYSYDYLDDAQFARSFVRDRINFHPCGRYKLVNDLKGKGIDEFLIEDTLADIFPEDVEWSLLSAEAEKCQARGKSLTQTLRYLYGKGFSTGLINRYSHSDEWGD